jgi:hypothetical protein
LRNTAAREQRAWPVRGRWLAVAAGVMLAVGLTGAMFLTRSSLNGPIASDALAQDAVGDHRNCALNFRLVRAPIPLEDAAERFDSAYRLLLSAPPDDLPTPGGPAHVVERHSCAYGARRFGHVVMQYRGRVVSLLVTARDGLTRPADIDSAGPHLNGRPIDGLSVVAVHGPRHAILLVSDLERAELTELSNIVATPLARRLDASVRHPHGTLAALLFPSAGRRIDLNRIAFPEGAFADDVRIQAQPSTEAAHDIAENFAVLFDGVGIVGGHHTASPQIRETNRGIW